MPEDANVGDVLKSDDDVKDFFGPDIDLSIEKERNVTEEISNFFWSWFGLGSGQGTEAPSLIGMKLFKSRPYGYANEKLGSGNNGTSLKQSFIGLVEQARQRYGGNVTVQRNGVDLFRVHQINSGHGFRVTQFINRIGRGGMIFKNNVDVTVRRKHLKQLDRALNGDPKYTLRTRGGR